jgi:NADH:ubiquinone oxidoreductase subunit K
MDLVKYLTFSMILFLLGIWGIFLNRKNILIMLMLIELMLLVVNLNFLVFFVYLDDMMGQLFALFVLTVAAMDLLLGWPFWL